MQNVANQVLKYIQDLEKSLKLKFVKKQSVQQHILFQDFFRCEKTARILGSSFLKGYWTAPNKLIKANSIATKAAIFLFLVVQIISFGFSMQKNLINIMFENFVFCGSYFVLGVKIYLVFKHNRGKIDEIVEVLDKHFPHFGVD